MIITKVFVGSCHIGVGVCSLVGAVRAVQVRSAIQTTQRFTVTVRVVVTVVGLLSRGIGQGLAHTVDEKRCRWYFGRVTAARGGGGVVATPSCRYSSVGRD